MFKDNCGLKIEHLSIDHIPSIVDAFSKIGWNKPAIIYEKYIEEQNNKERESWIGLINNQFVGYVTLKWESEYLPFKQNNIPEIKDLNVLPQNRNHGIGSNLLDIAERCALEKSDTVGIGVGLSQDYGSAQRLYIKNGYVPDGRGITYKHKPVKYGNSIILDDDLIIWFTKKLKALIC